MDLRILPKEIVMGILLYLQCPVGKLIKDEIETYDEDHNWVYTKMTKLFYVKNMMPFSYYYFDKFNDPYDYDSYHKKQNNTYIC